jgi:hypothetical protein
LAVLQVPEYPDNAFVPSVSNSNPGGNSVSEKVAISYETIKPSSGLNSAFPRRRGKTLFRCEGSLPELFTLRSVQRRSAVVWQELPFFLKEIGCVLHWGADFGFRGIARPG